MRTKKIIIVKIRNIIFGAIGVVLIIASLLIVINLFGENKKEEKEVAKYQPGKYTEEIKIGNRTANLEVLLEENQVKGVNLTYGDEMVETMYPLMKPTVEKISNQLEAGEDIENIESDKENMYTEKVIIDKIKKILKKEKINEKRKGEMK